MDKTKKSIAYSQNFLKNQFLVRRLLGKSSITGNDLVLEIGPGTGVITTELVRKAKSVIAIEIDDFLFKQLIDKFKNATNISIINQDILNYNLPKIPYKVFSNIPFNITADIIKKLTSTNNPPTDSYLIVQFEAASKYSGIPNESMISLLLKPWFEFSVIFNFSRNDFSPVPKVKIVLFRIKKRNKPLISNTVNYKDFICYAFNKRTITLYENLKDVFTKTQYNKLAKDLGFNVNSSPTMLSFKQWLAVYDYFSKGVDVGRQALIDGSLARTEKQQAALEKRHKTTSL